MKTVWKRMWTLYILLAGSLASLCAMATTVMPLSLNETVRGADAIVVGTITSHQSRWGDATQRWIQTDYRLAVEDTVYPSEQGIAIPRTIVLTYWGGTIGDETQAVADIRQPNDGEQLVMMLHSRWNKEGSVAPTVGFNYGLFSVVGDTVSGKRVVRDAAGQSLALATGGQIVRGSATSATTAGSTEMNLTTFKGWLRDNVSYIKATPARSKPTVDPNDPRLMNIITQSPAPAGEIPQSSSWMIANSVAPAQDSAAEAGAGVPPAVSATDTPPYVPTSTSEEQPVTLAHPKWSTNHQAHLPIVVNQFVSTQTPWSPEDQYQMSKWNYYASDVFHVLTTPTGTYAWGNGRFDMAGWMNDTQRQNIYGSTWYCGAGCTGLAVTFMRYDGSGWIIEADIALNSGVSWTLDDEWVFDGGAAIGFRQSMIHELGHMHGLNHNFGFPALMNYFEPGNYRDFAMPFMDDVLGIRFEYSANTVARTDLAAYLYSENGICYDGTSFFNCITEATYPSTVVAGQSLTVNNYHVENVGTTTISTPTIEWYLTTARTFSSGTSYSLGTTTYSSLNSATYFTPSSVGRTFTVPANVPAGSYYLAAYIRGDGGAGQGTFPFSNNYAFSLNRIAVSVPPSVPTIGTAVAGNTSISVAFTPGALGSGTLNYYTADCGGFTHTGSGSPITVSGLLNGTSYTCKVKTTTTVGTSAWSGNSNSVTPFLLPSAPTISTATGTASATIDVAFTPGAVGSGTLRYYTADCGGITHIGYSSPIQVVGLINGTSYTCRVNTTTSVGTSAWSGASNAKAPVAAVDDGFPSGGTIAAGWIQPVGSNLPWFVTNDTAYGGTVSLKSGHIGNSQKSEISYTAKFAAGNVSFARKVSSELGWDYLRFYVDGVQQGAWSGEVPWSVVSFPISAGTHTLLWRYVKDVSNSLGSDAAWIDAIQLPSNRRISSLSPILMLLLD